MVQEQPLFHANRSYRTMNRQKVSYQATCKLRKCLSTSTMADCSVRLTSRRYGANGYRTNAAVVRGGNMTSETCPTAGIVQRYLTRECLCLCSARGSKLT